MITRVRKSFIRITMVMLTLVLIIPLFTLNILTAALNYNNNKEMLKQIAQTEIYILDPRSQKPPEKPEEDFHNVGIGKQQNPSQTSRPLMTTTVTTSAVSTKGTTFTTTVKNNSVNDQKTTVKMPQTTNAVTTRNTNDIHTDVPPNNTEPHNTRPQRTEPHYEWTRPTRPEPEEPVYPPYEPPFFDYDYGDHYYDQYGGYNYGAVFFPSGYMRIASFISYQIQSISKQLSIQNTTGVSTSYDASTETVTTTVSEEMRNNEPIKMHRKVFNNKIFQPMSPKREMTNSLDHFIIYLDKNDTVTEISGTEDYTIQSCTELIENVNSKDKYEGYIEPFQYVRKNYSGGAVVVFSDRSSDLKMIKNMILVTSGVFLLMEVIVFFLTRLLTKRAMRPMQISYEKQQQFISDAGHELKTPLTVISANADILSDEIGENKWLTYIKGQAERMRILVQEMLDLTKITNSDKSIAQSRFNISSLIENVALPFECQAFEQKKTFKIELEPDVQFFGNTERIRRMIGIFIDNAFKYSNENGTIKVQLVSEGSKKILKIYNTGIGIQKGEEDKIFERFYRSDSSRSTQGGYGLGLAIAKSIADQNNIKINVQTEPGQWISFNLTL